MTDTRTHDAIGWTGTVETPPEQAFEVFTDRIADWWPSEYTWSGGVLEEFGIEPHAGGRCFERGPHGFHCDWGRVLVWEPGKRLVITWQISPRREPEPDPAKASEIEVVFTGNGSTTEIQFEHRNLARHGEGSDEYRTALASEQGWPWILGRFVEALE